MKIQTFFFETLPLFLKQSLLNRIVFFCLATLGVLLINGYHFGTFDQAIHIPYVKQMADPSLYPNDPFLALRFTKYSYFWHLFVPFLNLGLLEYTLFAVYLLSVCFTFYTLWRLSMTLFASEKAAGITVLSAVFLHAGFGFVPLFEFDLVNRVVALPFALLCIDWYLHKKTFRSFFLLGVLANFHALTAFFTLAILGIDMVLRIKEGHIREKALSGVAFFLGAFPVLLWKLQGPSVSFSANWPWFWDVSQGFISHLYIFHRIWPPYALATASGLVFLIGSFVYARTYQKEAMHKSVWHFFIGITLVLGINALAATMYPSEFIIQFQLHRIGLFAIIFFQLYASDFIASAVGKNKKGSLKEFLLVGLLATGVVPFMYILGEYLYRRKAKTVVLAVLFFAQLGLSGVILFQALEMNVVKPGIHIFLPKTPSVDMQLWVKNNTDVNALVIAPPYLWSLYDADFRVVSERSTVALWSDLLDIAFTPSYHTTWASRFDDVAPGSREMFSGFFLDNQQIVKTAYLSLSSEHMSYLIAKYKASYMVSEKTVSYAYPVVYENKVFRVYDVR